MKHDRIKPKKTPLDFVILDINELVFKFPWILFPGWDRKEKIVTFSPLLKKPKWFLTLETKKLRFFHLCPHQMWSTFLLGHICPRLVRALKMCLQCPEPEVSKQSQTKMPPPPCFPDGVRVENPFYIAVLWIFG